MATLLQGVERDTWHQLIVASTIGAAAVFALLSGVPNQLLGRKVTILAASIIFAVGSVVMGVAPSKEVLLVGRLVVGAGSRHSHCIQGAPKNCSTLSLGSVMLIL